MRRIRPKRVHTGNGRERGCAQKGCEHSRVKGASKCQLHLINYDKAPKPHV